MVELGPELRCLNTSVNIKKKNTLVGYQIYFQPAWKNKQNKMKLKRRLVTVILTTIV
jgi:hypothetical protein